MELSLRFIDNQTGHRDLHLRFCGDGWVCDSYSLANDDGLLPEREDAEKIRAVLRRLLEQWLAAVERLTDGGTAYLPYDFSDQCTAWLACRRVGSEVTVSQGWADAEGWSSNPSEIGDRSESPCGFRVTGPTVQSGITEFVEAIRRSWVEAT